MRISELVSERQQQQHQAGRHTVWRRQAKAPALKAAAELGAENSMMQATGTTIFGPMLHCVDGGAGREESARDKHTQYVEIHQTIQYDLSDTKLVNLARKCQSA